jgi:branched-chain amino acid transport system permease protein
MLGGILGWWTTSRLGLDFFSGLALVIVVMGAFGWLVDRLLIERVRDQGEEAGILLTIGLAIFLSNTALLTVGTTPLKVEGPMAPGAVFIAGAVVTKARIFAVLTCAVLMAASWLLINRTRLGAAMRATFQDPMAAQLAGIRASNIYACTFALGTVITATAGMLLASIYSAQVSIGGLVSLKAFVVVILGGMGSFAGAIVGGLLLGLTEALWGGYVASGWVDIIGFLLVIVILVFRPYGLFSRRSERA